MPLFTQNVSGSLSFSGSETYRTSHKSTASLSFSGSIIRRTNKLRTGALNFIGALRLGRVFSAALSFAGNLVPIYGKIFPAALSFVGNLVPTLLHFAVTLSSSVSFSGTVSTFKAHIYQRLLSSTVRFNGALASGWLVMRASIFTLINWIAETVFGWINVEYKLNSIIQPLRALQTIGTAPQLIDLSDLSGPPACLFIKNTNDQYFVEVDSSSSFSSFPQRIPPGKGVFLSPETTTIYARAIGHPVDILLSPSLQRVQYRKTFQSSLRFSAPKVHPEAFIRELTSTLSFHGNLIRIGPGTAFVMKADGTAGDAYASKLFSDQSEVWVTFDMRFDSAALTWFQSDNWTGDLIEIQKSDNSYQSLSALYGQPGFGSNNWGIIRRNGNTNFTDAFVTANAWHTIELHFTVSAQAEGYIDGGSAMTTSSTPTADLAGRINFGTIFNDVNPAQIVYFRNLKVGTTRGGTEIFSDDFSSGDLSNWNSVTGGASVIPDPF